MSPQHIWIVPPTALGRLHGMRAIDIGPRAVRVQLLNGTYRIARSKLPRELPADFASLAELATRIAREHGTAIDPIIPDWGAP